MQRSTRRGPPAEDEFTLTDKSVAWDADTDSPEWLPESDFAIFPPSGGAKTPIIPESIKRLFHYTTASGLNGILSSGSLRASNFSFLNDATEFSYGLDMAKDVLRKRLRDGDDKPVVKKLIQRCLQIVDELGAASEVYVTCFSTVGDLLSQWRAYGSGGGRYCIEFDPRPFRRDLISERGFNFGQVLYSESAQTETAYDVVLKFIGQSPGTWDFSERDVVERGARNLAERLIRIAPLLKHAGFQEECEWRAVEFHLDEEIEFDCSSGLLRPYMKLITAAHFKSHKLPIVRIIVGAVQHHSQAVKAARLLADRYGYHHVDVVASSIPFRG